MKKALLTILFLLSLVSTASATTYYVRNDGGSSTQCTGTTDAAYPGSGTAQACAFRSPATALKIGSVILQGGDTLIIDNVDEVVGSGQAQYNVGFGGDDITGVGCAANAQEPCRMASIPAGTSGAPTKIYGKNHASCDNLTPDNKAELFGSGDQYMTFDATNTDWVEIKCLSITDHDQCAENGNYAGATTWQCDLDCTGDNTCTGVRRGMSINNSGNILLENVDIFGQSNKNLEARDTNDITIKKSKFVGGAMTGIEFGGTMTGSTVLDQVTNRFSGCTLKYPLTTTDLTSSTNAYKCNSKNNCSGFGDGISYDTGGSCFNITVKDSDISYNTSDGWDFLHCPTGSYTIQRSRFEGNAGQAVKTGIGNVHIENSKLLGNCDWWAGQTFTNNTDCDGSFSGFELCRAQGNTLVINSTTGTSTEVLNNTFICRGDIAIQNANRSQVSSPFNFTNNVVYALQQYNSTDQCIYYTCCDAQGNCGCSAGNPTTTYSVVYDDKNGLPAGTGNVTTNPLFTEATTLDDALYVEDIDVTLQSTSSSAYNIADETAALIEDVDFNNFARGAAWDSGAYEQDTTSSTCSSSCSVCGDQTTCEASSATNCSGGFCCWQPVAGVCSATAEATCNNDCSVCVGQTACEASTKPCYWWSTSICNATEEPSTCDDDCDLCLNQSTCEASAVPCDWSPESVKEDLTTYVETDSGGNITIGTFDATVTNMQVGVVSSVCKDFGDVHFDDFVHDGEVTISARTDGQIIGFWSVNNGGSTIDNLAQAVSPSYVLSYGTDGGSFSFYIEYFGDPYAVDSYVDASDMPFTVYYTVTRTGTSVSVELFSDSARTVSLDTISVTGSTVGMSTFCAVLNRGVAGTETGSLVSTNIALNEVTQCVAEAAATCDTDCTVCVSQQGCEGSALTCFWHSDNTCNATAEAIGSTDSVTGGGITGGSISWMDKEPMKATAFRKNLSQCYEDAVNGDPCIVEHRDYTDMFFFITKQMYNEK